MEELDRTFQPEFLNRIDEIILFRSLTKEDLLEIVDIQMHHLRDLLAERQIGLELAGAARQHLADAGYDCGLAGKLHLSAAQGRIEKRPADGYRVFHWSHHPAPDWPENDYIKWVESKGQSWEKLYHRKPGEPVWAGMPTEFHQTTWCAEKTIEFVSEERDSPWLMSFNCFDPHHAFDPPAEYLERYDPDDVPAPSYQPGELDNKTQFQRVDHQGAYGGGGMSFARLTKYQRRQVVAAYYAMIELIDDQVGRMLQALDDMGQRENTLVIFTSDHGEMLGDHGILLKGPYFYECMIRVPLILRWPARWWPATRSCWASPRW